MEKYTVEGRDGRLTALNIGPNLFVCVCHISAGRFWFIYVRQLLRRFRLL